jgi:hypothetical protein
VFAFFWRAGRPDWANFRTLGDCFVSAVFFYLVSSPTVELLFTLYVPNIAMHYFQQKVLDDFLGHLKKTHPVTLPERHFIRSDLGEILL